METDSIGLADDSLTIIAEQDQHGVVTTLPPAAQVYANTGGARTRI